ncbi:MAG: hypothetical protein CMP22_01540 [Rickettsiales bacterium]|nr:hypothetical protein [Rickettsiales bacterium]|tara:strand:+ start:168 stop:566 length:399 start_codon:yes stop_codon:yes gene_type:complete
MGGIAPILSTVGGLVSVGTTIAASNEQAKQQQRQIEVQKAENKIDQEAYEADRKDRLKRAAAAQRARFGASGVSTAGSGSAVLLGLQEQTDDEIEQRATINNLRNQALSDTQSSLGKRSLLDAASLFSQVRF